MLGLPDLYAASEAPRYGDTYDAVGIWDPMSWIGDVMAHLTAWHKLKLGFIDPSQIVCLAGGDSVRSSRPPG